MVGTACRVDGCGMMEILQVTVSLQAKVQAMPQVLPELWSFLAFFQAKVQALPQVLPERTAE